MADKTITGVAGGELTSLTGNEALPCSYAGQSYWFKPGLINQISTVASKSADYTITDDDGYDTILVTTGATDRTITLPTAADNTNRKIKIVKVDSGAGTVTIDGEGAETINGDATKLLVTQYSYMEIMCDGTEWFVVDFHHVPYATSWAAISDWTNVELSVTHNFSANISDLSVRIYLSSDGTDGNAISPIDSFSSGPAGTLGLYIYQSSTDAFYIQTGGHGVMILAGDGTYTVLDTESYYYKIVVEKNIA